MATINREHKTSRTERPTAPILLPFSHTQSSLLQKGSVTGAREMATQVKECVTLAMMGQRQS